MLCKIVPIAYESTKNSNLLRILLSSQSKRKHRNTVTAYDLKHQQIFQVLNTSSGVYLEQIVD